MKITFINYTAWPNLNHGLASLISSVKQAGHSVNVVDLAFAPVSMSSPESEHYVVEGIQKESPDVIGVSTSFDSLRLSNLIGAIRERVGDTPIFLGGVKPTYRPIPLGFTSEYSAAWTKQGTSSDYETHHHLGNDRTSFKGVWMINAEGEIVFLEALRHLELGNLPEGKVLTGKPADLNKLPAPDFTHFDMPRYLQTTTVLKGHIPLYASKGCTFSCRFCVYRCRPYQHRQPKQVVEEILIQKERHWKEGMRSLGLYDPTAGLRPKLFDEMMCLFKKEGISDTLPWFCQTRPELVTKEWAETVVSAGCSVVQLGLECGLEKVRYSILDKRFSNVQFRQAVLNLKRAGLQVECNIMSGLPNTPPFTDIHSLLFAASCRPTGINFPLYSPNPSTPLNSPLPSARWEANDGAPSKTNTARARFLKWASGIYFLSIGLWWFRGSYLKALTDYLLNVDRQRELPLSHPLTTSLLSNRLLNEMWLQKQISQGSGS